MLEAELNNEKSEPREQPGAGTAQPVAAQPVAAQSEADAAAAGEADGQAPVKATRTRRAIATRAAGPPSESALAPPPTAPAVPPVAQAGFSAPETPVPVAQPSFLAPQLIFQPPEVTTTARKPDTARSGADDAAAAAADDDGSGGNGGPSDEDAGKPRRRRGGRGRSKGKAGENGDEPDDAAADGEDHATSAGDTADEAAGDSQEAGAAAEDDADSAETPARRRRRRRRRGGSADVDQPAPDDPPETVVHVREPRAARPKVRDEVQGLKGSTRLEAKKQRRREGRDLGRRRPPIITESEFLARREAVDRVMVVRQRGEHTQIAVLEDDVLVEHYVDKTSHQSFVGNVYLGKVQNVLPSMEAAFVDIGKGRNAVLYAGEVNFDASGLEGQTRRIESALKSGQSVLVQVTKDPVGHKGARLTSQVSLPGRYLVYVPGASMMGISRKLPDTERSRLKQILKKVMPEDAGVIVRTAAEGATEEELSHDVARLSAQWGSIEQKAKSASPPSLLYSEPDLTIRVIRDIFNEDFSRLVVSGEAGWDMVDEYVRYVAPHLIDRLTRWSEDRDVFAGHRIDEQLAKAMDRKVWLPSGGSLVIDKTEAMTVIDVNTGKFTGQGGNLEETVTRNNLEAAEEIVRQLRLRDIGGIIVIDFIDMVLESNRDLVLRRLLECLARDRTKHQVAEVTSLGLVQMTRKRVGAGLLEAFSVPCECCNGRGVIITLEQPEPAHRSTAGHRDPRRPAPGNGSDNGRDAKDSRRDNGRGNGAGRADRDRPAREERDEREEAPNGAEPAAAAQAAQAPQAAESREGGGTGGGGRRRRR